MGLSSSAVLLLVGTVSFQWRRHGSAVDASVLPAFPGYCSKDMSTMAIPSLSESVENSFDGVSAEDVELLQVRCIPVTNPLEASCSDEAETVPA